jgi:hypothetical protein
MMCVLPRAQYLDIYVHWGAHTTIDLLAQIKLPRAQYLDIYVHWGAHTTIDLLAQIKLN